MINATKTDEIYVSMNKKLWISLTKINFVWRNALLSKGNRVLIIIRAIQHSFLSCVCTYVYHNDKSKTIFPTAFSSSFSIMVQYFVRERNSTLEIVSNNFFYLKMENMKTIFILLYFNTGLLTENTNFVFNRGSSMGLCHYHVLI